MTVTVPRQSSFWSDEVGGAGFQHGTEGRWKHRLALGKPWEEGGWREVSRMVCKHLGTVRSVPVRQEGTHFHRALE